MTDDRRARLVFRLLYGGAALAGVVLLAMGYAQAHDGYEFECCDNRHCSPVPLGGVSRDGAYWVLPDGRKILAGTTRSSSAIGKTGFHVCNWNAGEAIPPNYEPTRIVQPKGRPVCLYAPDAEH